MPFWNIEITTKFQRTYKKYEKKHENELIAVWNNLDTYLETLQKINNPLNIKAGYIHPECKGIIAIDQKKAETKLKETRLYIYPDSKTNILYLLIIGDKKSQRSDIKFCEDFVKKI